MSDIQFSPQGRLHHLLTLEGVNRSTLTALLDQAERFRVPPGERVKRHTGLAGKTVVNLFFEPSTRTRSSFELAARRLGADVLNLEIGLSSAVKGESLEDTLYTLEAMNADVFVVRHKDAGVPAHLARHAAAHVHVLNAGEAHLSHPTQGLLDAFTIRRHKPNLAGLAVAIVGDIKHSRVARSAVRALTTLGTRTSASRAQGNLLPKKGELPGELFHRRGQGRGRRRRDHDAAHPEGAHAEEPPCRASAPTSSATASMWRASRKARPDAIVMHPGPMNFAAWRCISPRSC